MTDAAVCDADVSVYAIVGQSYCQYLVQPVPKVFRTTAPLVSSVSCPSQQEAVLQSGGSHKILRNIVEAYRLVRCRRFHIV
jgi:hypothetical protein